MIRLQQSNHLLSRAVWVTVKRKRYIVATCWMCNKNQATTGEHIFKHSILREFYGRKPFTKGNRLVVHAERVYYGRSVTSDKFIQSTDADELKFLKSLCENCNSSKSMSWDNAFDLFLRYLFINWQHSLSSGYVNLIKVYKNCNKKDVRNLYNYFCKLFGCLLFTNDQTVPNDIVDIVNDLSYKNALGINVVFDIELEEVAEFSEFLEKGDLIGDFSRQRNYRWILGYGPLKFGFLYKTPPEIVVGVPWYGKSKRIGFIKNV